MTIPSTPEDWLPLLWRRLQLRRRPRVYATEAGPVWRPGHDLLWNYYCGTPRLPVGSEKAREAYQAFMAQSRRNFAELVVEATRNRMRVVGFRTGGQGDELGDEAAWQIWQANRLDADAPILDRYALACGEAYTIVGDVDPDTEEPLVTVEGPLNMVAAWDPANRRRLRAALKWWQDDDAAVDRVVLFWRVDPPGGGRPGIMVRHAVRRRDAVTTGLAGASLQSTGGGWEWDNDGHHLEMLSRLPVARFVVRPDDKGIGVGEFERALDVIDSINTQTLHRLVTVAMQTFRQRALEKADGVVLPDVDPRTGEDIDYEKLFEASPAALWDLPSGIKIWESSTTDLQPILAGTKADVEQLAAMTFTPLDFLDPESANQSAAGAELSREGLVAKVLDRCATMAEGWEQTVSLAFEWKGDLARARIVDTECMWAPAALRTMAENSQAASQLKGVAPWAYIAREVLQMSPAEFRRYDASRADDLLYADTPPAGPAAAAVTAPAPTASASQSAPVG